MNSPDFALHECSTVLNVTTFLRNLLQHFLCQKETFGQWVVLLLWKFWQFNVLYFVAVPFLAKLLFCFVCFFGCLRFLKWDEKVKNIRVYKRVYGRGRCNYGDAFSSFTGKLSQNGSHTLLWQIHYLTPSLPLLCRDLRTHLAHSELKKLSNLRRLNEYRM